MRNNVTRWQIYYSIREITIFITWDLFIANIYTILRFIEKTLGQKTIWVGLEDAPSERGRSWIYCCQAGEYAARRNALWKRWIFCLGVFELGLKKVQKLVLSSNDYAKSESFNNGGHPGWKIGIAWEFWEILIKILGFEKATLGESMYYKGQTRPQNHAERRRIGIEFKFDSFQAISGKAACQFHCQKSRSNCVKSSKK